MTNSDSHKEPTVTDAPGPLERLAEHLAARPFLTGDGNAIAAVADWLDYSLNRCGLVIVEEQSLTRSMEAKPDPEGLREHYGRLRGIRDSLSMALAGVQGTRVTIHLTRAKQMIAALEDALSAKPSLEPIRTELVEWALNKSATHHQLAHENQHLHAEHIASSAAYRNLADELLSRNQPGGSDG